VGREAAVLPFEPFHQERSRNLPPVSSVGNGVGRHIAKRKRLALLLGNREPSFLSAQPSLTAGHIGCCFVQVNVLTVYLDNFFFGTEFYHRADSSH